MDIRYTFVLFFVIFPVSDHRAFTGCEGWFDDPLMTQWMIIHIVYFNFLMFLGTGHFYNVQVGWAFFFRGEGNSDFWVLGRLNPMKDRK